MLLNKVLIWAELIKLAEKIVVTILGKMSHVLHTEQAIVIAIMKEQKIAEIVAKIFLVVDCLTSERAVLRAKKYNLVLNLLENIRIIYHLSQCY